MDNLMNAIQQEAVNTAGHLEQKLLANEKNKQCTCTTFSPSLQRGMSEPEVSGLCTIILLAAIATFLWIEQKRETKRKNGLL